MPVDRFLNLVNDAFDGREDSGSWCNKGSPWRATAELHDNFIDAVKEQLMVMAKLVWTEGYVADKCRFKKLVRELRLQIELFKF